MDGAAHRTEQQIEQPVEQQLEQRPSATKLATCYKSAGGCGVRFPVPADGPLPSRCSNCRGGLRRVLKQGARGRAYDCDGCGVEFRGSFEHEQSTYHCPACLKHGPLCLGGCGVRSKTFRAGKTHCTDCEEKRAAVARASVSSARPSLLSTGYAQAMAERMKAADEKSAAVAPSPMFVPMPSPPAHRLELRSRIADETVQPMSGRAPNVECRIELMSTPEELREVFEALSEPEQQERPMASGREATCQKSAGGCGKTFKAAARGKLPKRCPECKAAGTPRAAKEPRAPRAAPTARKPREVPVPQLGLGSPSTIGALFTVRVGQLAIDCHTAEALDVLVQRYGAAS